MSTKLRKYLKEHKIGMAEFAERVGVDRATLWRWLQGKSRPNLVAVKSLQHVTHGLITPSDFGYKTHLYIPRS